MTDEPIHFKDLQDQVAKVKEEEKAWHPELLSLDPSDPTKFKLRLKVSDMLPDRTQYKPYGITYIPDVYVEVTVSLDMIADFTAHYVVLTPAGIAHVADELATALDVMHDKFRVRDRKV